MKEIKSIHQLEFKRGAAYVVTLPTLYTLIGEFGEYCKGYSLFGATNETLSVAISKREDLSSRLFLENSNERKRFTFQNIKYKKEDRWANLIKGVVATLLSRSFSVEGFNLTLQGELLDQSNPTVDAAITLATTIALQKLFNLDLVLKECATISYSALTSFSLIKSSLTFFNALINIDNSSVLLYDLSNFSFKRISYPFLDEKIKSLIVNANVAILPFIQEIEEKENAASVAFEKLKLAYMKTPLREISIEEIKGLKQVLTEDEKRICSYIIEESQLAKEAARQLEQNELVMYGKTLSRVQTGLRDVFELTCPEIDWLAKRASQIGGCLGASMIIGSLGKKIYILMEQKSLTHYAAQLEAYGQIFGFKAAYKIYKPAEQLKVEPYQ